MDRIHIGKISGASGLKGEIKLFHYSGERERIVGIKELFFLCGSQAPGADEEGFVKTEILSVRYSGKTPVLQVAGVNTREDAEALIGSEVWVNRDSLAPLGEDSYYVEDLIGFDVTDAEGKHIGKVSGVLDNPAHDILRIIDAEENEILLPMVDEFVLNVNMIRGDVEVALPEGLAGIGGKG